jgi:hypothetical protein
MVLFKTNAMKQSTLLLLLFLCLVLPVDGQNLVPNFSFEEYTECLSAGDQVEFATGWSKYSTEDLNTTPDYYNACSSPSLVGVPQNFFFYQEDYRHCGAYAGLIVWASDFTDYREQIGIQLSEPLTVGEVYFLSFRTVLGGIYVSDSYYESPSNNIGLRLSTTPYSSSDPAPIDNFAHLHSTSIISDTVNWVRISGSFVADSAYSYVMLGNFYNDSNTDTSTVSCGSCLNKHSYYLIDDICVSLDSTLCNGGIDALPCIVSVAESSIDSPFNIYPNPARDHIKVENGSNTPFDIEIYSSNGLPLYEAQDLAPGSFQVDIDPFSKGMLFVKIRVKNKNYIYKLIKQ